MTRNTFVSYYYIPEKQKQNCLKLYLYTIVYNRIINSLIVLLIIVRTTEMYRSQITDEFLAYTLFRVIYLKIIF